jgi:hypothetical protein
LRLSELREQHGKQYDHGNKNESNLICARLALPAGQFLLVIIAF